MSERGVEGAQLLPIMNLEVLEQMVTALVGAGQVRDAQERLTRGMLREALQRTGSNYTQAARLLGVKRQAVQQMVARFGLEAWADGLRRAAPLQRN